MSRRANLNLRSRDRSTAPSGPAGVREGVASTDVASSATAARALAALGIVGATMALVSAALPGRTRPLLACAMATAAYPVGVALLLLARRATPALVAGALCGLAALVAALVAVDGRIDAQDSIYLLWCAPMTYFCRGRELAAVFAFTLGLHAALLAFLTPDAAALQHEFALLGTYVVFTVWTRAVRRKLEAVTDGHAHAARTDALTGLLNRAGLVDRLGDRLPAGAVVLLIDLDDFKPINDEHGHAAGDRVLRVVAVRLLEVVRGEDAVARIGGDEFVVVLRDGGQPEVVVERMLAAIREPVPFGDANLRPDASIGMAKAGPATADLDGLLTSADTAMYAVKRSGRRLQRV